MEVGRDRKMMADAHMTVSRNSYEKVKTLNIWVPYDISKFYHEEIKYRRKTGNSCCYAVQILLSSQHLSNNLKIKTLKTLVTMLHGCEIWSFTLREKRRLRVFENMILM